MNYSTTTTATTGPSDDDEGGIESWFRRRRGTDDDDDDGDGDGDGDAPYVHFSGRLDAATPGGGGYAWGNMDEFLSWEFLSGCPTWPSLGWRPPSPGGAGRGGAGVQISLPVTAKRIRKLHRGTGKVNTLSRGSGTDRCAIIINDVH